MVALRCQVTGNLCGTDTLPVRFLCACTPCTAFAELADLTAQLAEDECVACAGTGTPVSGLPCMCGGSGRAGRSVTYLLERLVMIEQEADAREAKMAAQLAAMTAERDRLREALLQEAAYCYAYSDTFRDKDGARANRHRERGDRLKRAALGGG